MPRAVQVFYHITMLNHNYDFSLKKLKKTIVLLYIYFMIFFSLSPPFFSLFLIYWKKDHAYDISLLLTYDESNFYF